MRQLYLIDEALRSCERLTDELVGAINRVNRTAARFDLPPMEDMQWHINRINERLNNCTKRLHEQIEKEFPTNMGTGIPTTKEGAALPDHPPPTNLTSEYPF